ncbi:uncharacterized protein [Macrobrachium rosenbergii]|uniref:uncharacterized protein isoform X2 n=1 Tax=Macrobrachium rosenbergii TaxID=79674 RepID=UPI0034D7A8A0
MFVGSTGSGKATLINGIINYTFAVNWDDDFRFKLITEPESHSHAKSQTNKISSYTIHHQEGFRIPYTLTIVDTPDIDIQGIKRDKELSEQIRTVFSTRAIGGISAIAFVVQSSLPRLTPTQRFIFDQILSLFGKDIASNIFLLLTFADCQQPQVLSGIREANIPYRRFFKFNNSALYACSTGLGRQKQGDEDNNFDAAMFWKMGENSFMRFFEVLRLTESKTLALTREVLEELHRKEVSTTGLQIGLYKLEQLRKELEFLISHQADIDRNKNFEYTVTEETFVKEPIPARQFITNCLECRRTCHENCQIKDDDQKQGCWAMKNGNCRICPGHCHCKMHKNSRFKYIYKRAEKTKTTDYLRSRYEEAKKKKLSAKQLIDEVEAELQAVQTKVLGMTETVRKTVKRLREIALKPDPLSIVEYIDAVIGSEKSKAEPGRPAPSMKLQDVRKNMEYLKEIADWTESVYYINNSFS